MHFACAIKERHHPKSSSKSSTGAVQLTVKSHLLNNLLPLIAAWEAQLTNTAGNDNAYSGAETRTAQVLAITRAGILAIVRELPQDIQNMPLTQRNRAIINGFLMTGKVTANAADGTIAVDTDSVIRLASHIIATVQGPTNDNAEPSVNSNKVE